MIVEKYCRDCSTIKGVEHFNRNARKPDGFDIYCKPCCSVRNKADYAKHKEKRLAAHAAWREANPDQYKNAILDWGKRNPEKLAGYHSDFYQKNRERLLEQDRQRRLANIDLFLERERAREERDRPGRAAKTKKWRDANPGMIRAQAAKRRAIIKLRMPGWMTEVEYAQIEAIYLKAAQMTAAGDTVYHVDHDLPLKGKYVSGLHVPANLKIISAQDNLRKSNIWKPE
jgi:hypothetical protein